MRTTIVPAQIMTVEDKIAANLTLMQIVFLLLPLFFDTATYVMFPPTGHLSLLKVTIGLCIAIVCSTLAVRIKGQVMYEWILLLLRYNIRPRYWIADKNDSYLREVVTYNEVHPTVKTTPPEIEPLVSVQKNVPLLDTISFDTLRNTSNENIQFTFTKKGGIHVSFAKIA